MSDSAETFNGQQPKRPIIGGLEHPVDRFTIPKVKGLELLSLPTLEPNVKDWPKTQEQLRSEAQAAAADYQKQLVAKFAGASETPGDFLTQGVNFLGDILTRAGWRYSETPVVTNATPIPPTPNQAK